MVTNAKSIVPAIVTHPGSILKKELKARGIKQKDFARAIGMPAPNLSELIKGKRNVTETIAIRLEDELGIPFQNWMNLQNRYYYVMKCRQELDAGESKALAEEQSLRTLLNMKVIYEYFGISSQNVSDRLSALKEKLAIDLNELQSLEVNTDGYFKRSENLRVEEVNMRTWLLLAWSEASRAEIAESYTPEKGLEAALSIARKANEKSLSPSSLKEMLNKNGIAYLHIPKLDAAPIDAYSMMTAVHPAIVVTYRHNDLDKLAFDVLHEIGHIRLHINSGKSFISVENGYSSKSQLEREADQFANDVLIPPHIWNMIVSAKPDSLSPHAVVHAIAREAEKNGISASIAVARYKHETQCYNIRRYRSLKITG